MTETQTEMMESLDALLRLGNLHTPMAVRVAATLRLVDHIRAGKDTPEALAAETGADAGALLRVIRHLIAIEVLAEPEPGRLEPTELGDLLASGHPAQQRDWFDLTNAVSRADLSFLYLLDAVRTGHPTYERVHGRPFYDDLSADPELAASFDALMACDQDVVYDPPAQSVDWTGVRHVMDVGGGTGGFLKAILRAAPEARGTLLELAVPAATAREEFKAAGLDGRAEAIEGDFFEKLPVTADVIGLSFVLLNWSDENARKILRRCTEALNPGGRILVLERDDVPEEAANPQFTLLDLRMLVFLGGRLRTRDQWSDFAASAGLTVESVTRLPATSVPFELSLLVLKPS
ncbi:methyltransferase [Spirillospora sp. NPDC047279]|uniref:methyltransferase n=1 Tax=Spirillospora sp. NPDC047279 TaxID=3155478 RepID=UPI0033C91726